MDALAELHCDCGYIAVSDDDGELVIDARHHAWTEHRTHLTAEVILSLAGTTELGEPRERRTR